MAGVNGNVTFTEASEPWRSVKKVSAFWYTGSGDTNGQAWGQSANYYDGQLVGFSCRVNSGSPQNAYNVRVLDDENVDVLGGEGLNRDNATNPFVAGSSLGAVAHSKLNVYIANANFNRNGTVVMYIR